MIKILLSTIAAVSFFSTSAFALYNDDYFTIDETSFKIEQIDSGILSNEEFKEIFDDCSEDTDQQLQGDIWDIINIGKDFWRFIEDNQASSEVNESSANALPAGVLCWGQLESWVAPQYKTYQMTYENKMGMEVVNLDFRFIYSYGGSIDGQGAYLANVTMTPMSIDVSWGFSLIADIEAGDAINVGTREDPNAGLEMSMKWKISSVFQSSHGQVRYYVQGDGAFIERD